MKLENFKPADQRLIVKSAARTVITVGMTMLREIVLSFRLR